MTVQLVPGPVVKANTLVGGDVFAYTDAPTVAYVRINGVSTAIRASDGLSQSVDGEADVYKYAGSVLLAKP